jgi:hypothetical protein
VSPIECTKAQKGDPFNSTVWARERALDMKEGSSCPLAKTFQPRTVRLASSFASSTKLKDVVAARCVRCGLRFLAPLAGPEAGPCCPAKAWPIPIV